MRNLLAAFASLACLWVGSVGPTLAQVPPVKAPREAAPSVDALPGSYWTLLVSRTDKETWNSRPRTFVYDLAFLDEGKALLSYKDTYLDASLVLVSVSGNKVTLKGDGKDITFDFINGNTTGKGTSGIFKFNVAALQFQKRIDLDSPSFIGLRDFPTCQFVSRQLQAAAYDFFGLDTNGALAGALQTNRYGAVVAGGWRAPKDTDSFRDVKVEYDRRRADMNGCRVMIDGAAYGLEMLAGASAPSDRDDKIGAVYRLKAAPAWLQSLRVAVIADWGSSPWVQVYAGRSPYMAFTPLEASMAGRGWTSVSDAPAAPATGLDRADHDALLARADAAAKAGDALDAVKLRNDACSRFKDWEACYAVAKALHNADGVAPNKAEALRRFEAGCDAGHANSCWSLGYELKDRTDQELRKKGAYALQKACNLGAGGACNSLGLLIEREATLVISGDDMQGGRFAAAYRLYQRGCLNNDAGSCRNAGITAHTGEDGVPVDRSKAVEFHTKACKLGAEKSCSYGGAPRPPLAPRTSEEDREVDSLLEELGNF